MKTILATILASTISSVALSTWADCDMEKDKTAGPYGPATFFNITETGTVIYGLIPQGEGPFPLVGFMHGSTGEWGMYKDNLELYASHGFVVVFPHIKSPSADTHWWETNTDGKYLIKAIEYAIAATADSSNDLFGKVDTSNVVYAGHSMGATCSIKASHSQKDPNIKLTITQHPGICGPFGPPPSPATWTTSTLNEITTRHPVLFTTATNDGAFWPSPHTAPREYGCFEKAISDDSTAAFI